MKKSFPWQAKASCRSIKTSVFYPIDNDAGEYAKAICERCPVKEECLSHALMHREREGVWGGTTERERRSIIRRRTKELNKQKVTTV